MNCKNTNPAQDQIIREAELYYPCPDNTQSLLAIIRDLDHFLTMANAEIEKLRTAAKRL